MPVKAAVISLGSISSKWVVKAMKNYFREVDDLNIRDIEVNLGTQKPEVLYKGEPLDDYDCIYLKGSFRYAALLRSITTLIEKNTYVPIDHRAFTLVHDKLLTQLKLQQSGVPMPKTYLAATLSAAKKILENINYPIIMKFPQGTHGKGVMFAESYPAASSMLDALTALKQPFLIQEYIETEGSDIRAIVVGDKIVAAMRRIAHGKEKRSNIHAGGTGEVIQLDALAKKIAIDAARAMRTEICGVDMLETPKGPVVIEVNVSPGLQGITKLTKIDIADKIAKYLFKKTKEYIAGKKGKETEDIIKEASSVGAGKEIITVLDFRGERILLPDFVTKESEFNDKEDVLLRLEKGKIIIKKFDIGKEK